MRVALVDDSALFRAGLGALLKAIGADVTVAAANGTELTASLAGSLPDVVILDIRMPPGYTDEGLVLAEQLRRQYPELGILVLSTYAESHYAMRLLSLGKTGLGYLLKDHIDDVEALGDALHRISQGACVVDPSIVAGLLNRHQQSTVLARLTEREKEVLSLMAEGRSNQGIGQATFLSARTVEKHIASAFGKLDLPSAADDNRRVLAVLAWLRANEKQQDGR